MACFSSRGRFKIYIIDEVHMLTPDAFNALLKTLEEPPPHVKFIFATTRVHKVPPTILSRCQHFDFRRLAVKDIVDNLRAIAKKENLACDDEVLILIAKHSDGSMRDAQVMFDQIASFTEGRFRVEDASKILGAVSDDILFDLADSIKKHDPIKALKTIDALADEGKEIVQVILYLIEHFRNLSVIKVASDPKALIDASSDKIKRYEEQAHQFTLEEILYIIYTFSGTLDFVRKSNMARIPFEVAMVKLTRVCSIVPSSEIIERLDKLEDALKKNPSKSAEEKIAGERPEAQKTKSQRSAALDEIVSLWPAVLNHIKERKISVAMYLKEGYPACLESNTLSIEFPKQSKFHKEMLEAPDCKHFILKTIKDISGLDIKIKFTISESDILENNAPSGAFEEPLDGSAAKPTPETKDDEEPLISEALEIFNGEIESDKGGGRRK